MNRIRTDSAASRPWLTLDITGKDRHQTQDFLEVERRQFSVEKA